MTVHHLTLRQPVTAIRNEGPDGPREIAAALQDHLAERAPDIEAHRYYTGGAIVRLRFGAEERAVLPGAWLIVGDGGFVGIFDTIDHLTFEEEAPHA